MIKTTRTLCQIGYLTAAWSSTTIRGARCFTGVSQPNTRSFGALTTKQFVHQNYADGSQNGHKHNKLPKELRHEYFALRHGQSLANVGKTIQSNPAIACHQYGLSDTGHSQARQAGQDVLTHFQQSKPSLQKIVLLSSDLQRALETAETVVAAAEAATVPIELHIEERLRERWFGDWDGTSDENYERVWEDDRKNADHTIGNVESVHSVTARATEAVAEWDSQIVEDKCMVICVAHGDVLQLLQTAFLRMDASSHRDVPHLETAQLRALQLAS